MFQTGRAVSILCAFVFAFPGFSGAAVHIEGHIEAKLHLDKVIQAEGGGKEVYEGYSDSHITAEMFLPKAFSITAEILLEGEPSGHGGHGHGNGDSSFFGEHDITLEEFALNFQHESGNSELFFYGGKFTPIVHFDGHKSPGVYGYRLTHEYVFDPRLGLGGGVAADAGDFGKHRFDLSMFAADTTVFSNNEGRRLRKSDGGVSNTGDLSSFALSIGGNGFRFFNGGIFADFAQGLSYRLGYAKQEGAGNEKDESRYSISARNRLRLMESLSVTTVGEYVNVSHLNGEAAHDRGQTSVVVGFDWKKWTLAGGYAFISNSSDDRTENRDGSIFNFSLSRAVGDMKIGVGYRRVEQRGNATGRIGALLSYQGEFSSVGETDRINRN